MAMFVLSRSWCEERIVISTDCIDFAGDSVVLALMVCRNNTATCNRLKSRSGCRAIVTARPKVPSVGVWKCGACHLSPCRSPKH
jgi:hypothetical protein